MTDRPTENKGYISRLIQPAGPFFKKKLFFMWSMYSSNSQRFSLNTCLRQHMRKTINTKILLFFLSIKSKAKPLGFFWNFLLHFSLDPTIRSIFQKKLFSMWCVWSNSSQRFTCNLCLKRHMRDDTGEKPFPCHRCYKLFFKSAYRTVQISDPLDQV